MTKLNPSDINFTVGAELEFYIFDSKNDFVVDLTSGRFPQKFFDIKPEFEEKIKELIEEVGTYGFEPKQESGPGQFEVQFKPYDNSEHLIDKILEFKYLTEKLEVKYKLSISFDPKPVPDQPGSALHVHLSSPLFDPYGLRANDGIVSAKRDADNEFVLHAIGGMLAKMKEDLPIFIPDESSHKRITGFMNAPTKICWGRNNRSVAIRIPDSKPKRIEHRVAGANADPAKVIKAVIDAAVHGIVNRINPGEPIWGNAWDKIYERELL